MLRHGFHPPEAQQRVKSYRSICPPSGAHSMRGVFASNSDPPLTFCQCAFPLALGGREGCGGMIGVDLIGGIRRAYFEQRLPIKEIVRRLAVSRATVRRVIRSQKTEFRYQRGVQLVPKLGEWVAV